MAMPRGQWKPRKRILLENPGVVRDILAIQKVIRDYWDPTTSLAEVVDYLLQSYRHANDREASLEFRDFHPRITKVFPDDN